jgi:hypothetical protein
MTILHIIGIISGIASIVYNAYDIMKYILSFFLMKKAGLHCFIERRNFSIAEMKIINDFLVYKKTTFFRLCDVSSGHETIKLSGPVFDHGTGDNYDGPFRVASVKEQAAIDTLAAKGFLKRNHGLSSGDRATDEILDYGDTFITPYFRSRFHTDF